MAAPWEQFSSSAPAEEDSGPWSQFGKATSGTSDKSMLDKGTEAVFGAGPDASMPVSQRILRVGEATAVGAGIGGTVGWLGGPAGAASGALIGGTAGALGEIGEQATAALGGGRLLQVMTGLVSSAPSEALTKALPSIARNLAPSNLKYLLSGIESPAALAKKEAGLAAGQEKQFGPKTPGYTEGQEFNVNQNETQDRLAKEFKFGEARAYAPSGKVEAEATTPGTALATGKEDFSVPGAPKRSAGYTEKLEPVGIREAKVDPKTGQKQKVSEVLRDEMYQEVGNITVKSPSQRFSSSPEFKTLQTKLDEYVAEGQITKADRNHLISILKSDQGSLGSQQRYGQTVDSQIRSWAGKPGATGPSALSNQQKNMVRNDLRDTFAEWTDKQGFGAIEKDYRSAFRQEKIAEAKDYIPRLISRFDGKAEATQFARQMVSEMPETKQLLQKELNTYFANLEPKDIPAQFNRVEKLLVDTDILRPEELNTLRQQVADVQKGGDAEAVGKRIKRILSKQLKQRLPQSAARSAAVGQMTDKE